MYSPAVGSVSLLDTVDTERTVAVLVVESFGVVGRVHLLWGSLTTHPPTNLTTQRCRCLFSEC